MHSRRRLFENLLIVMIKPLGFLNAYVVLSALLISANHLIAQSSPGDVVHLFGINAGLKAPIRLAIDASDNIYVSDTKTKKVLKYSNSGTLLANYSTGGSPVSLAVNADDQVFVGEEDGKILKMSATGTTSLFYSDTIYPSDMAFSPEKQLYIVDSRSKRVIVLDAKGNLVRSFGSGTLEYPTSIAYDSKNERVFVGEHGGITGSFTANCKVWVFKSSGGLITSFGRGRNGAGRFYRIQGIAMGKCGNIYVNDPFQGNISVFNENLAYITKFGVFGDGAGQLNLPMDVTFDSQERIIVSSLNNGAIELFNVQDTLPTSNITPPNTTICAGDTADIIISFTGTAPWSFTYTHDGSNPTNVTTSSNPYTLQVSDSGIYEITALSDANYTGTCFSGYANVKLNNVIPTSAITSPDDTVCEGIVANVEFNFTGISPWTFTYSIDSVLSDTITTSDSSFVLPVTEAGLYEVTSLKGNGCSGVSMTGNTRITVNPLPTSVFAAGNNTIDVCQGDTFDLDLDFTGTAPWTFTYTIDDMNPVNITTLDSQYVIKAYLSGVYQVKQLSDLNCVADSTDTHPEIIVHERPTAALASIDSTFCQGHSIQMPIVFTGEAPYRFSYRYRNASTVSIINIYNNPYYLGAYQTGVYKLISVSDKYCDGTDLYGQSKITVDFPPDALFTYTADRSNVSFTNGSTNADSYLWDFGDGHASIKSDPDHIYFASGTYIVSLTATNWCGNHVITDTIEVDLALSNHNIESEGFNIYPNPSDGKIYLELSHSDNKKISLEVIDVSGKTVMNEHLLNNSERIFIDLSNLSEGFYIVRLMESNKIRTAKLIIEKK